LTLPRLPATPAPGSFEGLRAQGLQALQQAAGQRWTDHNLHDPGITMLEAMCFALTDLVFRTGFPVADRLMDEEGRIAWAAHGLHLPEAAFPCRPTTRDDLRRWVLDRVPGLEGVSVDVLGPGRLGLVLDAPAGTDRVRLARRVRVACGACRALGEEVVDLRFVERRPCTLVGELEVGGARDPVDIVADLYEACAAYVAAAVDHDSCRDALARGASLDEVLDGPYTRNGIARPQALALAASPTLSLVRLAAVARAVEGVRELRWLGLKPEGEAAVTTSLPWRDPVAGWTLALRPPTEAAAWLGLRVLRRGMRVEPDPDELARRCAELRAARLARRQGLGDIRQTCPPPQGRVRPPAPGLPLHTLLPPLYVVGRQALPAHASTLQRARARQLQAYLALFDMLLAHAGAQIDGLRSLYDTRADQAPSYHWRALDDADLPGLAELLDQPAPHIVATQHAPLDPAIERRSRLLDSLLALQGHAWPQNTLRQFCDHLTPREREARLLALKLRYLRQVVTLSRDRSAGIDPARCSWGAPNNIAGLQRLASLLLGFDDPRSRALAPTAPTQPPRGQRSPQALPLQPSAQAPAEAQRLDLDAPEAAGHRQQPLAGPAALQRCAVRADRWATVPDGQSRVALLLGPDEDGRWWRVAGGRAPVAALRLAARCRRAAGAADAAAEGLHVVEHGLLRPLADGVAAHAGVPAAFHDLRLTVLMAGWTQRGQREAFHSFAEETLHLACPAHLRMRCLWLQPEAMAQVEPLLKAWLEARRRHTRLPQQTAEADSTAAALAQALLALSAQEDRP
jgi:hypothetical protein